MEIEIKNKKENQTLQRQEVTGELTFTGSTPSNTQLQDELAKKLNTPKEQITIKHIYGKFGTNKAEFQANVYSTKEQHDKIEPKPKQKADAKAPAAK